MEHNSTEKFYDDLSEEYHLNYSNWDNAMVSQASVLDKLIKAYAKEPSNTLLDCSCGIGTQAIGLARLGYQVTASDLSPLAIKRAGEEALKRKVNIHFAVADFLQLETLPGNTFDVVISCDNSIPHVLTKHALQLAAKNILTKMNPQALFIASIRDYDELLKTKPVSTYPVEANVDGVKIFSFQTWEWAEENIYTVSHFTIQGVYNDFTTHLRKVQYRAYQRNEITAAFEEQGFTGIKWLLPVHSGYYQPIMVAFKP